MSYISPTTWVLYGLAGSQLCDSEVPFVTEGGAGAAANITVGEFVQEFFGYEPDFIWWCPLIVFAYISFFRGASVLIFSYVSYQRR